MSIVSDLHPTDDPEENGPTPADQLRARLLTTEQLGTIPKPEPLVDGLLYLDSLAMLYGPSGAGKSFVGIDVAMHVASDHQWWNSCELANAPVLYMVAEGASGIRLRTDAWTQAPRTQ
jgi:RecA-family ATPase